MLTETKCAKCGVGSGYTVGPGDHQPTCPHTCTPGQPGPEDCAGCWCDERAGDEKAEVTA